MLQCFCTKDTIKRKTQKSLSKLLRNSRNLTFHIPNKTNRAKALQRVRLNGSFTVEAAFVVPLFLLAAVVFLGLFQMLLVQIQITGGLQYASRKLAVSCRNQESGADEAAALPMSRVLFQAYLKEHGFQEALIQNGNAGISFLESHFAGEYIELRVSYRVKLPVSVWRLQHLPVTQCVRCRKWIGADTIGVETGDDMYVYVTETGSAYHSSTGCSYLDLSIQNVTVQQAEQLRSKDGSIYYPCSCWKKGQPRVYITNYGTQYHGNLSCSGLKRTVYRVRKDAVGGRHPCSKCYKGG